MVNDELFYASVDFGLLSLDISAMMLSPKNELDITHPRYMDIRNIAIGS